MEFTIQAERLAAAEYIEFLKHTDLGVIRSCTGQGIGRALVEKALETAGGEKDIILYTCPMKTPSPFMKSWEWKKQMTL